jgi:hypothetical protein
MSTLTQSLKGETTEETLARLHQQKLESSEDMMEYLLSSMEFLKTGDLDGWTKKFDPAPVETKVKKRLRQSPNKAEFVPLNACRACSANEVVEDVTQGQQVCTHCGLIQTQGVFTGDIVHCSVDRLKNGNRVHIHRYSRVVHFRTSIRLMQGDSQPEISDDVLCRMRAELGGDCEVTASKVAKILLRLGLSRKYRRHRWRIACLLGGVELPMFDGSVLMEMFKKFRVLEYYWDHYHEEISPGRVVFFSYKFVFYQFCHMLGYPSYTGAHHLLKNEKLRRFQFDSYRRASKYTGFPVYDP